MFCVIFANVSIDIDHAQGRTDLEGLREMIKDHLCGMMLAGLYECFLHFNGLAFYKDILTRLQTQSFFKNCLHPVECSTY